jgi:hypothetical protein
MTARGVAKKMLIVRPPEPYQLAVYEVGPSERELIKSWPPEM